MRGMAVGITYEGERGIFFSTKYRRRVVLEGLLGTCHVELAFSLFCLILTFDEVLILILDLLPLYLVLGGSVIHREPR
jgi:hypothetical protein